MDTHPLTDNTPLRISLSLSAILLAAVQAALLVEYAGVPVTCALADGLLAITLLGISP